MIEEWKSIKGYEDYYEVSSLGRVRSLTITTWNGKVYHKKKGRILKLQTNQCYNKVTLSKKGQTKQHLVHRLVAIAFIPNPENKPETNHKDYDTYNNNIENLEWVTAKENDTHKRKRVPQICPDVKIGVESAVSKHYTK